MLLLRPMNPHVQVSLTYRGLIHQPRTRGDSIGRWQAVPRSDLALSLDDLRAFVRENVNFNATKHRSARPTRRRLKLCYCMTKPQSFLALVARLAAMSRVNLHTREPLSTCPGS